MLKIADPLPCDYLYTGQQFNICRYDIYHDWNHANPSIYIRKLAQTYISAVITIYLKFRCLKTVQLITTSTKYRQNTRTDRQCGLKYGKTCPRGKIILFVVEKKRLSWLKSVQSSTAP